jgi:hypothetical protein
MVPKMDLLQVLYAISGSLLRNCFVSPLWIRQTDTQGHQQRVLSRFFSLLLPLPTAADSPSSSTTTTTIMAKRKATVEEVEARAESNSYKRGAHREKDSARDNGKHNDKTKKN